MGVLDAAAVARYLDRIDFTAPVRHDLATLEALQRSHLTAVPFENLHVFHRRGVRTDPAWSVSKIVDEGRGGWCFELNGAFSALLESLGFTVTRLAATVLLDGAGGEEADHLTIRVDLEDPFLVDVGFGDSFQRPLAIDDAAPQDGGHAAYRLRQDGGFTILEQSRDGGWDQCFRFDWQPRQPEDFTGRSEYLQTEPGLRWTEAPFATRLIDGGPDRVWLLRDRLKLRSGGVITEKPVAAREWPATLDEWFGMDP